MRSRSSARILLRRLAVLALLLPAHPLGAARIPEASLPPGFALPQGDVVFRSVIPLAELLADGWTEKRLEEIARFREQMRRRDEIFLLINVTMDAIGSGAENVAMADDLAQSAARRLQAAGVPADRMLVLSGGEDEASLDPGRLTGFERYQRVEITGLLGADWLRRRPPPEARKVDLPPPSGIALLEPAEGATDRANHMLRGTADASIRSVTITIGLETRTPTVRDRKFEVPISLRRGDNPIAVTGIDRFGRTVRVSRVIRYDPPRPTIEILSPAEGAVADVSASPLIPVRGAIRSRARIREAYLIQNDIPRKIRVRDDGTFDQPAILITEEDTFQAEAVDEAGETGTSAVRAALSRGVAARPLMAILHWDEDDVDLDLHVTDRAGNHSFFDAPDSLESASAIPYGRLWFDNRKGFGPEVFSLEKNVPEEYTISAEYYRGRKPCRAYLTLVLFAGTPSRQLVRIYGPAPLSPGSAPARIVRVSLPSGIVREIRGIKEGEER